MGETTRCDIQHKHGGQRCIREINHDGPCRSRSERGMTGEITHSEWMSKDGEFQYHIGYKTIYPANAKRGV